jgi:hypothetical protein
MWLIVQFSIITNSLFTLTYLFDCVCVGRRTFQKLLVFDVKQFQTGKIDRFDQSGRCFVMWTWTKFDGFSQIISSECSSFRVRIQKNHPLCRLVHKTCWSFYFDLKLCITATSWEVFNRYCAYVDILILCLCILQCSR